KARPPGEPLSRKFFGLGELACAMELEEQHVLRRLRLKMLVAVQNARRRDRFTIEAFGAVELTHISERRGEDANRPESAEMYIAEELPLLREGGFDQRSCLLILRLLIERVSEMGTSFRMKHRGGTRAVRSELENLAKNRLGLFRAVEEDQQRRLLVHRPKRFAMARAEESLIHSEGFPQRLIGFVEATDEGEHPAAARQRRGEIRMIVWIEAALHRERPRRQRVRAFIAADAGEERTGEAEHRRQDLGLLREIALGLADRALE